MPYVVENRDDDHEEVDHHKDEHRLGEDQIAYDLGCIRRLSIVRKAHNCEASTDD